MGAKKFIIPPCVSVLGWSSFFFGLTKSKCNLTLRARYLTPLVDLNMYVTVEVRTLMLLQVKYLKLTLFPFISPFARASTVGR